MSVGSDKIGPDVTDPKSEQTQALSNSQEPDHAKKTVYKTTGESDRQENENEPILDQPAR